MRLRVQQRLSLVRRGVRFEQRGDVVRRDGLHPVPIAYQRERDLRWRAVRHQLRRWIRRLRFQPDQRLRNGPHACHQLRRVRHAVWREHAALFASPGRRIRVHERLRGQSHALRLELHRHGHGSGPLRIVHFDVQRGSERRADLQRGRVRVRLQRRLSRLWIQLSLEQQPAQLRNVVRALHRASERDGHVRRRELQLRLQHRLSPLRCALRVEHCGRELRRIVHALRDGRERQRHVQRHHLRHRMRERVSSLRWRVRERHVDHGVWRHVCDVHRARQRDACVQRGRVRVHL